VKRRFCGRINAKNVPGDAGSGLTRLAGLIHSDFMGKGKFGKGAAGALKRPDWDTYFMDIAHVVARRGNCIRRQVAAVVVKDLRVVSTGYNGTPRGVTNCCEGGCERGRSDVPSGEWLWECICSHA